jgi:hypothetical protein
MIKIWKRLNDIIFFLFLLFILTNQFANYTTFKFLSYFFLAFMLGLISFSYFRDKKKIYRKSINFENFIFLLISLLLIYFYFQNENVLNLKMFIYFVIILLISNLIYQKDNLGLILHMTLMLATILLIIGFYGWFNGGEGGAFGNQYIYFAYRYLPSTRNEDNQIFLLAYIITLFFIFSKKNSKIYFILNSLFAAILFLSYSRGYWLIYVLIFLFGFFMNIFFKYIEMKKFLKIYLINIIFTVLIIIILNSIIKSSYTNSKLTLQNQFYTKINSIYFFLNSEKNYNSNLEYTSILSMRQKISEYNKVNKYYTENNKRENNYKYYESSFLFLLANLPLVFFLYLLYFAKELFFILKNKKYLKINNFFYVILIMGFLYLNTIYNLTEDSMCYFYFLLMLIFKKNSEFFRDYQVLNNSILYKFLSKKFFKRSFKL